MLTRQQLVRAALYAYPGPVRDELGAEMESTILDAGATPVARFARELLHLMRFGLNARAQAVAEAGTIRVIADGVCRGATWIMTLDLATLVVWRMTGTSNSLTVVWSTVLLAAVLAVAHLGYDRVAGLGGLAWMVVRTPQLADATPAGQWIPPAVLLLGCYLTMLLLPRQRAVDWRRLGWLAVPAWLIATFVIGGRNNSVTFVELLSVVLLVLTASVITLPTDPRLAIAVALSVSYMCLSAVFEGGPWAVLIVGLTPAVIGLAALRSRRLRRGAPAR